MKKEKYNGKIVIKFNIMWLFVVGIVIALIVAFFKDYIFAADGTSFQKIKIDDEVVKNKQTTEAQYLTVEKNENVINVLETIVENNYSNKKFVNEKRDINYEVEKIEDDKLPKGEEKIEQKGVNGTKQVNVLQTYQMNDMLYEEVINEEIINEPTKEIIHVGTSEFLKKYNVHINEEMYLIESGSILEKEDESSKEICKLKRYINVKLEDFDKEWAKIKYKDEEGYIQISKLTSNSVTPKIKEKNRIAVLQAGLNIDMDLSQNSGLTLNDYKTIFNYNSSDKNGIFSESAEFFYNAEQKYNINGIFLAAIGIHESAWGTSKLAVEKLNLFGYQAYDRDPINSAMTFETYEESINTVAASLHKNYLSEGGSYYNGPTLKGVNTRYASDKNWAEKVFKHMENLYDKLG